MPIRTNVQSEYLSKKLKLPQNYKSISEVIIIQILSIRRKFVSRKVNIVDIPR